MPHLIIERIRSFDSFGSAPKVGGGNFALPTFVGGSLKKDRFSSCVIEILDVVACVMFVPGSVCFLPRFSRQEGYLLIGCRIYVVASVILCVICLLALGEAISLKGHASFEVWENALYLAGSVAYLVGSVLFIPEAPKSSMLETFINLGRAMPMMSLTDLCDSLDGDHQLAGSILFIIGSVLFALAAFTNALNLRKFDDLSSQFLTVTTTSYLVGSLLFAMGSISFIPHVGCGESMLAIGAWNFIVASIFFVIGSAVSLLRTMYLKNFDDAHGEKLALASAAAASEVEQ